MTDPRPGPETIDVPGDRPTRESVRRRFVEDWEYALAGGAPPDPEECASALAEPDRSVCRGELAALDAEFRRRSAGSAPRPPGDTAAHAAGGGREPDPTSYLPPGPGAGPGRPGGATAPVPAPDDTAPPGDGDAGFAVGPLNTGDYTPAPDDTPPAPAAGPRRLPDIPGYELLGVLGRGGMGVVFKARQVGLKRLVALKMVRGAQASETDLRRFRTEAEAIARFQHPGIVQIHAVGEFQGEPFFSLELVEGGSLERHAGGTPQPVRWAAGLAAELADAVGYAHARGIVHRDLKPANVLLTADGRPKVTDFGLAKRLEEEAGATASGTVMGTPSYMAPEQAAGAKDVGPRADVYALGAILYDLLTGRPPFKGSTVLETLDQVRRLEPVPPRALQPSMPRDLETVCLKCLQKDPARRYGTAEELAADLRRFLDGRPILARPVGPAGRAWRWARRNPRWAGALAAAAVLLAGWAATATAQFYAVRAAKDAAEANAVLAQRNEAAAIANADRAAENEATATRNAEQARQERDRANQNADVVREQYQQAVTKLVETAQTALAALQPAPGQKADAAQRERTRLTEDRLLQDVRGTLIDLARSTDLTKASSFGSVLVHQKLGDLFRRFGRAAEGRAQYQAGVDLTRRILAAQPTPKAAGNLALLVNRLADAVLEDTGDAAAAGELYREAVALQRRAEEPDAPPAQAEGQRLAAATFRLNRGRTARQLGDPAAAAALFREAVGLRAGVAAGRPGEARLESFLAEAELLFGDAAWRAGDARAAEAALRAGLGRCEALTARAPADLSFKADAAYAAGLYGDMLLAAGRAAEALAAYRKHLPALEAAAAKSPRPDFRAELARAHGRVGLAVEAAGGDAAAAFAASLGRWEELAAAYPTQLAYQPARAVALARGGQAGAAVAATEALLARHPKHTELRLQAARCLARGGGRHAGRALDLLAALVRDGYRDRRTLEADPDLAPLRARPEFAALLAKVPG